MGVAMSFGRRLICMGVDRALMAAFRVPPFNCRAFMAMGIMARQLKRATGKAAMWGMRVMYTPIQMKSQPKLIATPIE
jgi:hypothetical protein